MRMILAILEKVFFPQRYVLIDQDAKNFFDYPSRERIKILRAAGREAQKEQSRLLKEYDLKFGKASLTS